MKNLKKVFKIKIMKFSKFKIKSFEYKGGLISMSIIKICYILDLVISYDLKKMYDLQKLIY